MKIIASQFAEWQATPAFREWFLMRFPEGNGKYQDVLNALAEDDRPDEAHWLMDTAGSDDYGQLDVTMLDLGKHVFAAGKLIVGGSLHVAGWIRAGCGIEGEMGLHADLGIVAGWNIRAGGSIRSNGEIKAGSRIDAGRNISAGKSITSACAIVSGGDIHAGKGIRAGTGFDSIVGLVEALNDDDSDASQDAWLVLQKLCAASSGSEDVWSALVGERNPFGLAAAGDICAGACIVSAGMIKGGDSLLAAEDIQSGSNICAGGNVLAGRSITTGSELAVKGSLKAGTDIVASWIHANGEVKAGGDVLFAGILDSGGGIEVSGNVRGSGNAKCADISAQGMLRVGCEVRCSGYLRVGSVDAGGDLCVGRGIRSEGDIIAGHELEAGRYVTSRFGSIRAGWGIKAGEAIQAAQGIAASREIVAGNDYGIFATTALRLSDWVANGRVIAKTRPENLISGYWTTTSARNEPTKHDKDLIDGNPPAVRPPASGIRLVESTWPNFSNDHVAPSLPSQIEWHEEWTDLNDGIVIKVIGVGGAGGNAIDHMIREGVHGVEFIVTDTDELLLRRRLAKSRLLLGQANLGASGHLEANRNTVLQERNRISESLKGAHMVFIVAGMGGATGTGFMPIIAEVAREFGILTVAVVNASRSTEVTRVNVVQAGIAELQKHVHCLIVLRNETLMKMLGTGVSMDIAFKEANDMLCYVVGGISENVNLPSLVNPNVNEVRAVMASMGTGKMGSAIASGFDRARIAALQAVTSPLLEGELSAAKGILVNITAIRGLKMKEVNQVMSTVRDFAAVDAQIIFGAIYNERMGDDIRVTVIALGHFSPLFHQKKHL